MKARGHLASAVVLVLAGVTASTVTAGMVSSSPAPSSPRLVHRTRADVDGSGRLDEVTLEARPTGGRLQVRLASGRVLTVNTPSDAPFLPGLVAVGNVDGRAGEELFVDVGHTTTNEQIAVYTYAAKALRLAGTLAAYGSEFGLRFGITCGRSGIRHLIAEHEFALAPSPSRRWTQRNTVYAWRGGVLRRLARGSARPIGAPPPTALVGVHCGHAPASDHALAHAAPAG